MDSVLSQPKMPRLFFFLRDVLDLMVFDWLFWEMILVIQRALCDSCQTSSAFHIHLEACTLFIGNWLSIIELPLIHMYSVIGKSLESADNSDHSPKYIYILSLCGSI